VVSIASSSVMSGMMVGRRFASIDFPVPGGPTIRTWWHLFPGCIPHDPDEREYDQGETVASIVLPDSSAARVMEMAGTDPPMGVSVLLAAACSNVGCLRLNLHC
jgi:hypothetical protein